MSENTVVISKVDTAFSAIDMASLKKKDTAPYLAKFLADNGVILDAETTKNLEWIPTKSLMSLAIAIRDSKKVIEA